MMKITQLQSFLADAVKRWGPDLEVGKNYVTANVCLFKDGVEVAQINAKTEDMEVFDENIDDHEIAAIAEGQDACCCADSCLTESPEA